MRRQGLTLMGEKIQSLGLAGGVAGLAIGVGAALMPSDRMIILFKFTAPYSLLLAGATALVVGPNARRNGYNDAIDRFQGAQVVSPQVPPENAHQQAPMLPPMATAAAQNPAWGQGNSQQPYVDRAPAPVAQYRAVDVASNGHRQPIDSADDGELY